MVILVSLSSVCLNFLESFSPSLVCLNIYGFVRNVFSCVWVWLEFSVLVDLVIDLDQSCRACFRFFFYRISCAVYFLVLF